MNMKIGVLRFIEGKSQKDLKFEVAPLTLCFSILITLLILPWPEEFDRWNTSTTLMSSGGCWNYRENKWKRKKVEWKEIFHLEHHRINRRTQQLTRAIDPSVSPIKGGTHSTKDNSSKNFRRSRVDIRTFRIYIIGFWTKSSSTNFGGINLSITFHFIRKITKKEFMKFGLSLLFQQIF